jgi:hypothetical protein
LIISSFFAILKGIKIKEYKFAIIINVSNIKIKLPLGENDIFFSSLV